MAPPIEHVALSVSDLDRSIAFYRENFDFEVRHVIDSPPEKRLGDIVGMPGASARIAHLYCGEFMLELFEYRDPRGRPEPADRTQADHGLIHIGFRSRDIHADVRRLRERGVAFFGDPVEYRPGVWVVYFHGPDREVLELRQLP